MPIANYPFYCLSPGAIPRPMLPIQIINPDTNQSFFTWGLVDTGADECALPAGLASILGHNLLAGKTKQVGTGNGNTNSYSHTTRINIFQNSQHGVDDKTIVYTINDTPIDFLPNLGCILLGVKNFLSIFELNINYPANTFSIRSNKK